MNAVWNAVSKKENSLTSLLSEKALTWTFCNSSDFSRIKMNKDLDDQNAYAVYDWVYKYYTKQIKVNLSA